MTRTGYKNGDEIEGFAGAEERCVCTGAECECADLEW